MLDRAMLASMGPFAKLRLVTVATIVLTGCTGGHQTAKSPRAPHIATTGQAVVLSETPAGGEVVTTSYEAAAPRMAEVCRDKHAQIVSIEPVLATTEWSTHTRGQYREQWQEMIELTTAPTHDSDTHVVMSSPSAEHAVRFRCDDPPAPEKGSDNASVTVTATPMHAGPSPADGPRASR